MRVLKNRTVVQTWRFRIQPPAPGTTRDHDDDDNSNHCEEDKNYDFFNVEVMVILFWNNKTNL